MIAIEKPAIGQDVRTLYKSVRSLVIGINSLLNMRAIMEGRVRGMGHLQLLGNQTVLRIHCNETAGAETNIPITTPDITVLSSINPAPFGTTVHWIASLTGRNITGTVQFRIDGVNFGGPVPVVGNLAISGNKNDLHVGNHTIVAIYSGDNLHNGAVGSMIQHIGGATTVDVVSNINPAQPGDHVNWTATVSPPSGLDPRPTGTVRFFVDGILYDTKNLTASGNTGVATSSNYIFSVNQAGQHVISVHYSGDANYAESDGSMTQRIQSSATLTLIDQPNPSDEGQPVDFYITVDGGGGPIPTGLVQLKLNGSNFGNIQALDSSGHAHYHIASMSAGTYTMRFDYSGDANYNLASSPDVTQVVQSDAYPTLFGYVSQAGLGLVGPQGGDSLFIATGYPSYDHALISLLDEPTGSFWDVNGNLVYQGAVVIQIYPQNGPDPIANHGPAQQLNSNSLVYVNFYPIVGQPANEFFLELLVPGGLSSIINWHCDVDLCVRTASGTAVILNTGLYYARTTFNSFGH